MTIQPTRQQNASNRPGSTDGKPAVSTLGLLDALPTPTVIVDCHGCILAANQAWCTDPNADDPGIGQPYRDALAALTPDLRQRTIFGLSEVLSGDRATFETVCTVGNDPDHRREIIVTISPLPEINGALISHRDAPVLRNHAEPATRTAESDAVAQLRRINEELDQFAYITSHDLKAPLRGIANLSRWIEEDIGPAATPAIHNQMELLRGRVHRMESLINGLLRYSRVGRVFTRNEEIDVAKLLAEVVDLLAPPSTFRIEIQGAVPLVRGERIRLQQVFLNLIGNAINHHDRPDGRVTITCEPAGAFYRFCVADDGPGIDPRFHERIFVIFQTLLPRDVKEAAGVGLSLVKKIVEEQGGEVTVESAPGQGAKFCFTWARDRDDRYER